MTGVRTEARNFLGLGPPKDPPVTCPPSGPHSDRLEVAVRSGSGDFRPDIRNECAPGAALSLVFRPRVSEADGVFRKESIPSVTLQHRPSFRNQSLSKFLDVPLGS